MPVACKDAPSSGDEGGQSCPFSPYGPSVAYGPPLPRPSSAVSACLAGEPGTTVASPQRSVAPCLRPRPAWLRVPRRGRDVRAT